MPGESNLSYCLLIAYFLKKLHKLKDKQLPLIHNIHTKPLLNELHLNVDTIKQCVHFKAQLFQPYKSIDPKFNVLNKECLVGFYVHFSELQQFSSSKFSVFSSFDLRFSSFFNSFDLILSICFL